MTFTGFRLNGVDFKFDVIMYRCMHGSLLHWNISRDVQAGDQSDDPGCRYLRSAARGDIVVLLTNTKALGQRNFAVYGPNKLPIATHNTELLPSRPEDILLLHSLPI